MDRFQPCCSRPATLAQVSRPFSKIVALGYYDGPTSGILQCEACQAVYKFDMLDWDDLHDVRIFRLAVLPRESLAEAVKELPQDERSGARIWVPMCPNRNTEIALEAIHQRIDQILSQAKPAELVIAWQTSSETVLAAKRMPGSKLAAAPDWFSLEDPSDVADWFSLLGLMKGDRVGPTKAPMPAPG